MSDADASWDYPSIFDVAVHQQKNILVETEKYLSIMWRNLKRIHLKSIKVTTFSQLWQQLYVFCFLGRKKSVFSLFFVVVAAAVQSNVSTTHIYLLQQFKKNVKQESKTQKHPLTRAFHREDHVTVGYGSAPEWRH